MADQVKIFPQQKKIKTRFLKIDGNCLEIENTCLQLSNISLFSKADIAPEPIPRIGVILLLAGLVLFALNTLIALLAIIIGGGFLFMWYQSCEERKEMKVLTIVTNSGNRFPIVFRDQVFLDQVVYAMTEIIRNPDYKQEINFNLGELSFSGSSSLINTLNDWK